MKKNLYKGGPTSASGCGFARSLPSFVWACFPSSEPSDFSRRDYWLPRRAKHSVQAPSRGGIFSSSPRQVEEEVGTWLREDERHPLAVRLQTLDPRWAEGQADWVLSLDLRENPWYLGPMGTHRGVISRKYGELAPKYSDISQGALRRESSGGS